MEITNELKQKWLNLLERIKTEELNPVNAVIIIQKDLRNLEEQKIQNIPIKLKVTYTDGDSFGTHQEEDELEYIWNDYEIAKLNLHAIKKHSELLNNLSWKNTTEREKLLNEARDEWWFVKDKPEDGIFGKDLYENSIYLLKDSGEPFQYSTPWTGFFANLQEVNIIIGESN